MYFFLFYSMVNIKTHAKNLSTYSSTREKPNLAIKYYHGVFIYLFTFLSEYLFYTPKKKEKRKKYLQRKGWWTGPDGLIVVNHNESLRSTTRV